uniref:Uncharacterized protein n=1 Tax=Anguilla anguilla TaxID=7936 RepID=A0A0E9WZC4_ANGAN
MKVKEVIIRLREKEKKSRDIGQTLGLPKSTARKIVKNKNKKSTDKLSNRKGPGRLWKTSTADNRRMLTHSEHPSNRSETLFRRAGMDVLVPTALRRLRKTAGNVTKY